MNNHQDPDHQDEDHSEPNPLREYIEEFIGMYDVLARLLARLPLPIELPPLANEDDSLVPAIDTVNRSRGLVHEQPVRYELQGVLANLLLDWLMVQELIAITVQMGPAPWRLDGLDRYLTVAKAQVIIVEDLLASAPHDNDTTE